MNIDRNKISGKLKELESESIWLKFKDASDRGYAIIAACYLDGLLEKLITTMYVKDQKVKLLFRDDHILQSFFAKINIAYFSGFIPSYVFHDLKTVCEIRNKFAHEVLADISFDDEAIMRKIDRCKLRPTTIDEFHEPRLKFSIVVTQIGAILRVFIAYYTYIKPPHPITLLEPESVDYEKYALTKDEILNILHHHRQSKKQ
jgi:DNA-binding MltR family transcriptional regulator